MMKKLVLALCLVLLPSVAMTVPMLVVPRGYWDGYDWKDGKADREAYTRGVVDGMLFASEAERNGTYSLKWLKPCLSGRSIAQIQKAIQHEIDFHPDALHDGMHIITYRALIRACPNSPKFTPNG